MVRVTEGEAQLTMLVVHAKHQRGGFFIALVPASLDAAEVDAALREVQIEAEKVYELGNWQTSSQGVAAAFVPFPGSNWPGSTSELKGKQRGPAFAGQCWRKCSVSE